MVCTADQFCPACTWIGCTHCPASTHRKLGHTSPPRSDISPALKKIIKNKKCWSYATFYSKRHRWISKVIWATNTMAKKLPWKYKSHMLTNEWLARNQSSYRGKIDVPPKFPTFPLSEHWYHQGCNVRKVISEVYASFVLQCTVSGR